MAIDMKTVKEIEFNNKQVKKIEDNNGNILWQKDNGQVITITFRRWSYGMYTGVSKNMSPSNNTGYGSYYDFRFATVSQLTDNTSAPPSSESDVSGEWILLTVSQAQNIVNKAYTSDTTIPDNYDFNFTSSDFYLCYIKNNELWFAGNTDLINVQSPNLLYTTNDISKALRFRYVYKPNQSSYNYYQYYDGVRTTNLSSNKYIGLTASKGLYLGYTRPTSSTSPVNYANLTYTI